MDALLLGASANSLSAARSLGRVGLRVTVAEVSGDAALETSRYIQRFVRFPKDDDAVIVSALLELPEPGSKPFLLATGDRYALLVARYQEQLAKRYCFVSPSYSALSATIDKAKLYRVARENGFPCPAFHVVQGARDIDIAVADVPTPCYVKPALGHKWRQVKNSKLERAESADELRRILATFVEMGLVAIAQEIIPGSDGEVFSLCTYIDHSGKCLGFRTKRKLRQWPLGAGNGCAQETCDQPEVAELGHRLLAVLGHRGPATVEFRRDVRTGRFVLIEINARTILAQEMITRSGLDVPLLAYHDAMGMRTPEPAKTVHMRWIDFESDFRAFKQLRERGQITVWQWLRSVISCRAFAYFARDDLRPALVRARLWLTGRSQPRRPRPRVPRLDQRQLTPPGEAGAENSAGNNL
jgi:D-aspartate ligase